MTGTDPCDVCVSLRHLAIDGLPKPDPQPATHGGTDANGIPWRACWPHHQVLSAWLWTSITRKKMTDD